MYNKSNSGNALVYVFMAIGLLGALTYSLTKGTRENYSVQNAARVAEEIYVQSNLIKSSIMQCTMEYVTGGGDLNSDGAVDFDDNPNNPFPLNPNDVLNETSPAGCSTNNSSAGCVERAADNSLKNISCVGAPLGSAYIFQGENNSGSFLPPPPSGFDDWVYYNNSNGVYIQITGKAGNSTAEASLKRLMTKFATCQADINYGNCGVNCFTVWVKRNSCP
jgi:hypothetical protein